MDDPTQLAAAIAVSGITPNELWLGYIAYGGPFTSLEQFVTDLSDPSRVTDHERLIAGVVVDEALADLGLPAIAMPLTVSG